MLRTITKGLHSIGASKAPQNTSTNLKSGTAPLSHMDIGSKWSYSTLEYPIDIQQRSDLGHYMMFYVNVMDSARSGYGTYGGVKQAKGGKGNKEQNQREAYKLSTNPTLTSDQIALRHEQEFSAAQDSTNDGTVNSTFTPGS